MSGIVEDVRENVDKNLLDLSIIALTRFGRRAEMVTVPANQIFKTPELFNILALMVDNQCGNKFYFQN